MPAQSPTGMVIDQAQDVREMDRLNAMLGSGEKFIDLVLKNYRKRIMTGVDVLHSEPYTDDSFGAPMTMYHHERRGGTMRFEPNPGRGAWTAKMLDTERNRDFLASHFHADYWLIEDSGALKDVEERAEKLKEEVLVSINEKERVLKKEKGGTEYAQRVRTQTLLNLREEKSRLTGEEVKITDGGEDTVPIEKKTRGKAKGKPRGKAKEKGMAPPPITPPSEEGLVTVGHGVKTP